MNGATSPRPSSLDSPLAAPDSPPSTTEIPLIETSSAKQTYSEATDDPPYYPVEVLHDPTELFPIEETMSILFQTLKISLIPLVFIVIIGVIVVCLYEFCDPVKEHFFDEITNLMGRSSYLFSFVSTVIFSGLIPFFISCCLCQVPRRKFMLHLLGTVAFFGFSGTIQSMWVTLINLVFENVPGGGHFKLFRTILMVAFDQLTYGPFYLSPMFTMFFAFRGLDFDIVAFRRFMTPERFFFREFPLTVSCNLLCWIPGMFVVYLLDQGIQFPVIVLLQCVYSLMLSLGNMVSKLSAKKKRE